MATEGLRTWIDVDLDALTENYRTACSLTAAKVTCVLKANAYGHGAVPVAKALREAGCQSFAVSCAREAIELRLAGIDGEILVMGAPEKDWLKALIASEVTLTAVCDTDLYDMAEAAAEFGAAKVHLKLDTGFHRLGFACTAEAADAIAEALAACGGQVRAEGLYSHLGLVTAERDALQQQALEAMRSLLADRDVCPADVHLCDSIGLVRYPQWHYSRVRVGAFLFGVRPFRSEHLPFVCRETLAFRARVAQVRDVPAGEVIGYDDSGVTLRPTRAATLCAGYGDGYPRCLSNGKGQALIHGRRAPVIGLICMDQMMVDVTDIPDCETGDTATLLGGGVSYAEYADWAHTNRNECLTILSRRPIRRYWKQGRLALTTDGLLD
ncbi:MAG: alanine racemase [Clostridia bacterium]|nr:alanine racemase [Clostridia bacterium]